MRMSENDAHSRIKSFLFLVALSLRSGLQISALQIEVFQ